MKLLSRIHSVMIETVLLPVRLYRRFVSPAKPPCCRFTPTCSRYAVDALQEWGILCGCALTLWRVLRYNPVGRGGEDPVPPCPWKKR